LSNAINCSQVRPGKSGAVTLASSESSAEKAILVCAEALTAASRSCGSWPIGPDPTRAAYPLETSPYYAMEHGEIFGSGYANYMQHWLDEPELFLQATAH
jgi:hypothetical protein